MTVDIQGVWQSQVSRRMGISAIMFLIWDTLINIDEEVQYIWKGPNTWVKWLYLFIRYFGVAGLSSIIVLDTSDTNGLEFTLASCTNWVIFEAIFSTALTAAVELVFLVRIVAIYERSNFITWLTTTLFVVDVVTSIVSQFIAILLEKISIELKCVVIATAPVYMGFWISSLVFQTVLFILTVIKYLSGAPGPSEREGIQYICVRDSIWAYALVFGVLLANLLLFKLEHSPLAILCFKWTLALQSFSASHILLNLRRLGSTPTSSNIDFSTLLEMEFTDADASSREDSGIGTPNVQDYPRRAVPAGKV